MTQRLPTTSVKNLEELLHRMTDRIRQSLELPEILESTVDEMRQFLKTDRVKIYQFHPDGSGEVVAEAIYRQRLPSLLGQRFPAEDIPEQARELFLRLRQRSIVNVATQEIGVSPMLSSAVKESLMSDHFMALSFRSVDPCHVEYLMTMGVQSSLVVPILYRHRLWGLLVAHHSLPKRFGKKELKIVQLIADQVTIAISHASLLQLTRLQGQHESIINQTVSYLHSTIKDPLKRALWHVTNALQCMGGRLYLACEEAVEKDRLIMTGKQPISPKISKGTLLEQHSAWRVWLQSESANQVMANLWAISDLKVDIAHAQLPPLLADAFTRADIRSVLVAKLVHQNQFLGYLCLFRQSVDIETVWAGQLDSSDSRQQRPRQSFEAWYEIKKEQANEWTPREVGLAQDLVDRFSSVIYQKQLYRKVQRLNADLEQRVLQRTAELQKINQTLTQEIAERERALEALHTARDSLKRLSHQNELILNAAGEGIYGIDPKGKIVFSNPAAAKLLGHKKADLTGCFMHDLLSHANAHGEIYRWRKSPIFKTLKKGQTHHVTGDLFEKRDGSQFPVEYVSTSIREQGKIIGAVIIFQDITERQMIDTMKDEFIAVVSHELRTPLTSIRAALGLLAQSRIEIPTEQQHRMIEIASSNTNRLVRLVSDILDVERIKLGKTVLNKQPCDLSVLLAQAVDEMRAMAKKHNIKLEVSPLNTQLYADPDKIIQTIANLLSNAIKFSPANSTVEISAQQVDCSTFSQVKHILSETGRQAVEKGLRMGQSLLLIKVADSGQGIPEDKLEAIFEQFEQLNTSDEEHQGGTGLGLAICRSIVRRHGGEIWAQSQLGKGSTFLLTLPISVDSSV
ncbi:MAG: ATP-binding protein [Cyanobacteria bacterium J06650_10]